jgi:hypothetical protein
MRYDKKFVGKSRRSTSLPVAEIKLFPELRSGRLLHPSSDMGWRNKTIKPARDHVAITKWDCIYYYRNLLYFFGLVSEIYYTRIDWPSGMRIVKIVKRLEDINELQLVNTCCVQRDISCVIIHDRIIVVDQLKLYWGCIFCRQTWVHDLYRNCWTRAVFWEIFPV